MAMDVTITDDLRKKGLAREVINRVQNFRKEAGFEVTDRIAIVMYSSDIIQGAVVVNIDVICNEVLANSIIFNAVNENALVTDIESEGDTKLVLTKV